MRQMGDEGCAYLLSLQLNSFEIIAHNLFSQPCAAASMTHEYDRVYCTPQLALSLTLYFLFHLVSMKIRRKPSYGITFPRPESLWAKPNINPEWVHHGTKSIAWLHTRLLRVCVNLRACRTMTDSYRSAMAKILALCPANMESFNDFGRYRQTAVIPSMIADYSRVQASFLSAATRTGIIGCIDESIPCVAPSTETPDSIHLSSIENPHGCSSLPRAVRNGSRADYYWYGHWTKVIAHGP